MGKLIGGPDLRARLDAVKGVPPAFTGMWAEDAAGRIRRSAPPSRRAASKRWTTKSSPTRGAVYGAYWWIFVDRGTKAHDIKPRRKQALKFVVDGETIFAKKTHHRRIARRPFITKSAQDALAQSEFATDVIKTWNSRRLRTRKRFL